VNRVGAIVGAFSAASARWHYQASPVTACPRFSDRTEARAGRQGRPGWRSAAAGAYGVTVILRMLRVAVGTATATRTTTRSMVPSRTNAAPSLVATSTSPRVTNRTRLES